MTTSEFSADSLHKQKYDSTANMGLLIYVQASSKARHLCLCNMRSADYILENNDRCKYY